MSSFEERSLQEALGKWKINRTLPAGFQDRVWSGIGRAEQTAAEGFWRSIPNWLDSLFSRQSVALIYVAALLILGLMAGYVSGKARQRQVNSQLAASYIDSVDPNQKPQF